MGREEVGVFSRPESLVEVGGLGFVITQRRFACGVGKEQTFRRGRHWGGECMKHLFSQHGGWKSLLRTFHALPDQGERCRTANLVLSSFRRRWRELSFHRAVAGWHRWKCFQSAAARLWAWVWVCSDFAGWVCCEQVRSLGSSQQTQTSIQDNIVLFNNVFYTSVVSLLLYPNINE